MNDMNKPENAVAAIRISSLKQGLQGDSPDAQKEQIERFAQAHNINVKKFFISIFIFIILNFTKTSITLFA